MSYQQERATIYFAILRLQFLVHFLSPFYLKNRYEKGCKILERMFLVFHDTINLLCIEHTTKRDVSSSLLEATKPLMPIVQKFNVTLPVTSIGGKYTRVFDTRLRMGEPHRLNVQSTEWLLPIKSRWPKSLQLIWSF